jgi:ribosomal protein S18 acetylase RimI-like enzyme
MRIRPAQPADEPVCYRICLQTGDNGHDATRQFDDPNVLGHIYVGPYFQLQPGFAFVLENSDGVCGYVLGALDSPRFYHDYIHLWLPPLQARLPDPDGNPASWNRTQQACHEIHHPRTLFPVDFHPYPSHLHIDLLPRAQRRGWGSRMIETLLQSLQSAGSSGVHLGVAIQNPRARQFYIKLGFHDLPVSDPETQYMGRRLT